MAFVESARCFRAWSLESLPHKRFEVKWEWTSGWQNAFGSLLQPLAFLKPSHLPPLLVWMGTRPKSCPVSGEQSTLNPRCDLTGSCLLCDLGLPERAQIIFWSLPRHLGGLLCLGNLLRLLSLVKSGSCLNHLIAEQRMNSRFKNET